MSKQAYLFPAPLVLKASDISEYVVRFIQDVAGAAFVLEYPHQAAVRGARARIAVAEGADIALLQAWKMFVELIVEVLRSPSRSVMPMPNARMPRTSAVKQ